MVDILYKFVFTQNVRQFPMCKEKMSIKENDKNRICNPSIKLIFKIFGTASTI